MFNPTHASREEMTRLAEHIENYIEELQPTIIIPDDEYEKLAPAFKEGFKRTKDLCEKLRKGKKDKVFKDEEDWNTV